MAGVLVHLVRRFQVQGHCHSPRARKYRRILDRCLPIYGVRVHAREPFDDAEVRGRMDALDAAGCGVVRDPRPIVEVGRLDDQCVAFPVAP